MKGVIQMNMIYSLSGPSNINADTICVILVKTCTKMGSYFMVVVFLC